MTLHAETPTAAPAPDGLMRAVVADRFGDADVLRLADVPRPEPVLGEVLVRVVAAGLDPADAATRAGRGAAAGVPGFPLVLGQDFSGVVVHAPYESFRLRPGDEVFGVTAAPRTSGGFAEYVAVPAQQVAPKPKVLTHAESAALPVAALTAWGTVVELAKAHEGQRVLVHGATGGVGHLAVQLAAYFGAHVIAAGSDADVEWLHELGAAETIDPSTPFEQAIGAVDAVIDLAGGGSRDAGRRSLAVLRPDGLLVHEPRDDRSTLVADAEQAGVRATTFRMVPDATTLAVLARLADSGELRVSVQEVFPLERMAEAHRVLERGAVRGRLVVQVAAY